MASSPRGMSQTALNKLRLILRGGREEEGEEYGKGDERSVISFTAVNFGLPDGRGAGAHLGGRSIAVSLRPA